MGHMIEDNEMSYVGSVPWHGLGVQVPAGATGIQMLEAANMTWQVNRRALAMRNLEGVMITDPLSNYWAIVRSDNDKVFNVSTDRYQPVQPIDIIDVFNEYCEAGHATMETVGALRGGAVIWALAKLNSGTGVDISTTAGQSDQLKGYVLMATSFDGSIKTIGKATQVRVVCHNTLTAAKSDGRNAFEMKHSKKFTDAMKQEAKEKMGIAIEQVLETNDNAILLSKVHIDDKDWFEFMTRLIGSELKDENGQLIKIAAEIKEATLHSPGSQLDTARGTLWGAVNGVTYYADHMYGRTQDTRLKESWFGKSDILKRNAMSIAVFLATAGV